MAGSQTDRDTLAVIPGVGVTAAEYAKIIEQNTMINLRVGMPGEVLKWYAPVKAGNKSKPAMVDVQPHFVFVVAINTAGELTEQEKALGWTAAVENGGHVKKKALPIIRNVPVHYSGAGGMLTRGKLREGEVGWIKFADRSIDKWTQTGGPTDPGFQQFHDLSDAIFEPGLRYGKVAQEVDDTKWTIGPENDSAGLDIDDVVAPALPNVALRTSGATATIEALTNVLLGANAVLGVARLTDTTSPNASMLTWMTQVTLAVTQMTAFFNAPPGPMVSAPGSVTAVPVPPTGFGVISKASAKVLAED